MISRPSFAEAYTATLAELERHGTTRAPRGAMTQELIAHHLECDPQWPLTRRPGWSERFALTETAQVIVGRGDMRQLRELAPQFEQMAPTYVTYGPRIAWQLGHVYRMLRDDADSRQAVVQVHDPSDTGKGYPEDPCTLSLQFLRRDHQLTLITTMRSNDAWLGLPTDVYMFTMLQREMAAALGIEATRYVHQAGSMHIYERHWEAAADVGGWGDRALHARTSLGCDTWDGVRTLARNFLDGEEVLPWSAWV